MEIPRHIHPKYRADIDGLRAVAVWGVLFFHAFPEQFQGGFVGVDVFFVISGYLISRILFRDVEFDGFTFRDFYSRRIRRIFPALIVVMTVSLLAGWVILIADEMNQLGLHVAAGAGFVSNLILWSEVGYFDTASELKPLLHLWSLGIEEQFYIFWPLLLWGAWKIRVPFLILTVLIALGSFALNIAMISSEPTATFFSPMTRAWELLCGGLLARFSLYGPLSQHDNDSRVAHLLSLCGSVLLIASMFVMEDGLAFPGWSAVLPVSAAVCLIAAGPQGVINRYVLSARAMVWFGMISFPLYLWHWPLLSFGHIVDGGPSKLGYRCTSLLLSVLLAWLTFRFVERPLRHGSAGSALKVGLLCALMALLGGAGFWISRMDLSDSHTFTTRALNRRIAPVGGSLKWYPGKEDWLFLGDVYGYSVQKLIGYKAPTDAEVEAEKARFAAVAEEARQYGIKVAFLLGPNKASIYPENLPDEVKPAGARFVGPFLEALRDIPGLDVHDPLASLREAKLPNELLYYRTDTHWNAKGAFLAFSSLQRQLQLPVPDVSFVAGPLYSGDLVAIGNLKDFPLYSGDAWTAVYKKQPNLHETVYSGEKKTTFGMVGMVSNDDPLVEERIWVIGDSFTGALRGYLNATYREVVYLGHWHDKLDVLPALVDEAADKPDRILIVRVERSF